MITYFFIDAISTPEVAGNILIAYNWPVYLCKAFDTLPYDPWPKISSNSNTYSGSFF